MYPADPNQQVPPQLVSQMTNNPNQKANVSADNPNRFETNPGEQTIEEYELEANDTLLKLRRRVVLYGFISILVCALIFLIFWKLVQLDQLPK